MRSSARAESRVAPGARRREDLGHAMFAAGDHGGGEMMRAGDDVGDDFGFDGVGNRWLEDADDGRASARRGSSQDARFCRGRWDRSGVELRQNL